LQTGGGASQLSNVEAGQILLAQRLGLIQHLPLIVWEGNRKNKDKLKTGNGENGNGGNENDGNENGDNKNDDFQTDTSNSTPEAQHQSSPINTIASSNSNAQRLKTTENTQSTSDNATFETEQPPSYEKSNILPTSFNQTTSSSNRNEILPDSSSSDKDDNECTICMEDFEEGNHIRYLPCMHFYHQACIDSWLMRSFTCPRCMEAVDSGIMASFAQQLS
jgi:E3 ubiquitin-protein ligase RNF11